MDHPSCEAYKNLNSTFQNQNKYCENNKLILLLNQPLLESCNRVLLLPPAYNTGSSTSFFPYSFCFIQNISPGNQKGLKRSPRVKIEHVWSFIVCFIQLVYRFHGIYETNKFNEFKPIEKIIYVGIRSFY